MSLIRITCISVLNYVHLFSLVRYSQSLSTLRHSEIKAELTRGVVFKPDLNFGSGSLRTAVI